MNCIFSMLYAGLGNKFGGLLKSYELSKLLNKKLTLLNVNNNLGRIHLDSIFDIDDSINYLEFNKFKEINILDEVNDFILKNLSDIPIYTSNRKSNLIGHKILITDNIDNIKHNSFVLHSHVVPSIDTFILKDFFKDFKIKNNILDIINHDINELQLDSSVFGIHHRGTDHPLSNHNKKSVINVINSNLDKKIFLITDDCEFENEMYKYPNVFFRKKSNESYSKKFNSGDWSMFNIDRSFENGVDAFIDMILLSKTNISLSPMNGSTFFNVIKEFSKINIINNNI